MNKWWQFTIGVISSGATQFGIIAGAAAATGQVNWIVVAAGVIGTMGTTAAGLLKQLPRKEWSDEKREARQDVTDAKEAVQQVARDEKE
jgi:hypothetical protein